MSTREIAEQIAAQFVDYRGVAIVPARGLTLKGLLVAKIDTALTKAIADERDAKSHPIATAPKDGTDILLWVPDGREIPIVGRWEPLVVSRKHKWVLDDGGFLEDRFPLPTHWTPLPPPPPSAATIPLTLKQERRGHEPNHLLRR